MVAADAVAPPEVAEASPAPATPDPAPELTSEIARLAAVVDDRDAELAKLRTELAARDRALADRDTEIGALRETRADRDALLGTLREALAEREAELAALRTELAALRERFAFDLRLAAMKAGEPPAVLEARADGAELDATLVFATAPGPDERPLTEIHFDTGSARLSPGGLAHAAAAAVMLGEMPVERVRLLGYTDRTGSPARNRALAEARARAVADFLVRSGFPADLIETAAMGETDLPVATGDGVAEPLNRCVAIVAVPRPTG